MNNTVLLLTIGLRNECGDNNIDSGSDISNNAFAGVGSPIKEDVCLSSTLNLASRSAEKITIRIGAINTGCSLSVSMFAIEETFEFIFICAYSIAAGAKPKLIKSANESSSLPIGE